MRRLRRALRRVLRALWRGGSHTLVLLLTLLFLLWLALFLAAGSADGTRWLLTQLTTLQSVIRFEVGDGTLRDGFRLRNFRFSGKKFHLDADELSLRLTWASLLRGELYVDSLTGRRVRLVFTGPPNPKPIVLKHPRLPLRLILADGLLEDIAIVKPTGTLVANRLALTGGNWLQSRVDIPYVELAHSQWHLALSGALDLLENYPLQAQGRLQAAWLARHDLKPVRVTLGGDLGALAVRVNHARPHAVEALATINVLQPLQDYRGLVRWGRQSVPWFPQLALKTRDGLLNLYGDRKGLWLSGRADLQGDTVPRGDYRLFAHTDWRSLQLMPLEARTRLGGRLRVSGNFGWAERPHWDLRTDWSGINLSRQWPALNTVLPVLNGRLDSRGHMTAADSALDFRATWTSGEEWRGTLSGKAWPWQWQQRQTLDFAWKNLNRQAPGLGAVRSPEGRLKFQGSLSDYRLETALSMASARTPAGQWRIAGLGGKQQFLADSVSYQGEAGTAEGSAAVFWPQGRPAWSATLALDQFRTDFWQPDWPANLSGVVSATGELEGGRHRIHLRDMALAGELREQPLVAQGHLDLTLSPAGGLPDFHGDTLRLDWGGNHIGVEGGLSEGVWDMALDAAIREPELLDERLSGVLNGVLQVHGDRQRPALGFNIFGEKLAGLGVEADALSVSGLLPALADEHGFLQVHTQNLGYGGRVIPQAAVVMEGTRPSHRISWQVEADPLMAEGLLEGGLSTDAAGHTDWQGESLTARAAVHDFYWSQQEDRVPVRWAGGERLLTLDPHCWLGESARLCAPDALRGGAKEAKAHLTLEGLDIARLSPLLPEGLAWQGSLEGHANFDWQAGQRPDLSLRLVTRQGAIGLAQDDDDPLTLPYDRLSLDVAAEDDGRLRLRFETEAPHIGQGYVESWIDPSSKPYNINGALVLEKVNLAILKPFFPGMGHLAGELNLAGGLSGSILGPDFYGNFSLDSAEVSARDAPLDLRGINIAAAIRGREAAIDGSFTSGEGKAVLNGKAEWSGEPVMTLRLAGKDLGLRQKPLITARVDPDLTFRVKPYELDVRGSVAVPQAVLRPQALSGQAIPLSPDVRVIDEAKASRLRVAGAMKQWAVNADIELKLKDKVQFEGFGLSSFMTGNLRLQQQKLRGMQATGEIDLTVTGDKEARYEAYGQKLKIRKGQVLFAGPVTQPGLNIEAVKQVADKTVGVRVEGRANAPTVQLFADTPMTQDEMLGYLLIGRPLYQEGRLNVGGGNDTAMLASAALSLGIKGGQGLASDLGGIVGLSDVALDAEGSGDDTQFTVSGYLSPRLYLRYGVGVFTPVSKVTLRYKISQSLYLEAVSSLENALDLFYNLKY